jgi:hypothetical protein
VVGTLKLFGGAGVGFRLGHRAKRTGAPPACRDGAAFPPPRDMRPRF